MKSTFFDVHNPDFSYPSICVVEGKDDAMFIECLLVMIGASADEFRIILCNGKPNLEKILNLLVKSSEYAETVKNVSIVFDADASREKSFLEIKKSLVKLGLPELVDGEFVEKDGKSFGVFLFPGTNRSGELEDLALELAPETNIVQQSVSYIENVCAEFGMLSKVSKRKIQVFLAGASADIRPTVGWAFRDGTIQFSEDQVQDFSDFIRRQINTSS